MLMWCFSISVLLKFKSTTSEAVKREICDKALALKDVIPGITRGSAGKNFSNRAKGFEWGKYCYFRSVCVLWLDRLIVCIGWVFEHASQKVMLDAYDASCRTLANHFVSRIWKSIRHTLLILNSSAFWPPIRRTCLHLTTKLRWYKAYIKNKSNGVFLILFLPSELNHPWRDVLALKKICCLK